MKKKILVFLIIGLFFASNISLSYAFSYSECIAIWSTGETHQERQLQCHQLLRDSGSMIENTSNKIHIGIIIKAVSITPMPRFSNKLIENSNEDKFYKYLSPRERYELKYIRLLD